MKRRIIIILVVIVLAVAAFFGYRAYQQQQAAANTNFQTVQVTRGNLTALIGATGTVRANQSAVLTWQITGSVGAVNAALGDRVNKDEVLAEIERTSLPQAIISAQAELITAKRNLENLQNSGVSSAKALQAVVNAEKAVEDAEKQMESKSYTKASQDIIDTAYANYILAQQEVDNRQQVFDGMSHLAEDDPNRAAALSSLAAAKQRRDNSLANYNEAKSRPDQIDVDQAQANLDLARANLSDAKREWERLKNGADPNDIAAAEARVAAIEATLEQTMIKAPFAGSITSISVKPGDQAIPGNPVFRVDDLSHMLVDVQLTEVDINRVKPLQAVRLTFDAIPDKEYQGTVVEVGQVGNVIQGVVNFTVTVEVTDVDENIKPGMTAAVNIVVSEIENVLLVPNRAVRTQDGKRVVYLLKNGMPTPINIDIGSSSDTQSELVSGEIKEGDTLVLNPPTSFGPQGGMMGGPRGPGGGGGSGQ